MHISFYRAAIAMEGCIVGPRFHTDLGNLHYYLIYQGVM